VPELPEVETIRRQLAPLVEGRVLARLEISDPRWCLPLTPEAMTRDGAWPWQMHARRTKPPAS